MVNEIKNGGSLIKMVMEGDWKQRINFMGPNIDVPIIYHIQIFRVLKPAIMSQQYGHKEFKYVLYYSLLKIITNEVTNCYVSTY